MTWPEVKQTVQRRSQDRSYILVGARTPACALPDSFRPRSSDGLVQVDIRVSNGWIDDIQPALSPEARGVDLGGRLVWPGLVDCHTHIDKGHVWTRTPNPDGTFAGAAATAHLDALRYQDTSDLRARAEFSLRAAFAHGTVALRSHVDASSTQFDDRFRALRELAQEWDGRIDLQLCPFTGSAESAETFRRLAQQSAASESGVLSVFLQPDPRLDAQLDVVFSLADKHGLALDFHADETLNPKSDCLGAVARAAKRNRFQGPVLVGHCCSLSAQNKGRMSRTLDLVAETQLGIVALPLCNMYLQDRHATRSPRRRGVAPLKEIVARGIPVAIASDNVRDAFHAYGDLDGVELFRDAIRVMHLDHPVGDWPATVSRTAADLIGRPDLGRLAPGSNADLILLPARNWNEFVARPARDRIVLRRGQVVNSTPPDFSELDHLEGLGP